MPKPASGTPLNTGHALYSGLTHFWPLWEGSGTPVDIVSSVSLPYGSTGGPFAWATDADGQPELSFDGSTTSQYVRGSSSLTNALPFTLSVGFLSNGSGNQNVISITQSTSGGTKWHGLSVNSSGNVVFYAYSSPANYITGATNIRGTRTSVACVAASATSRKLFRDGLLVGSNTNSYDPASTTVFWTTGSWASLADKLNGRVNWIAIHNRALSDAEAQSFTSDPWQIFSTASRLLSLRRRIAAGGVA